MPMRDEFLCRKCKHARITVIAAYQAVPTGSLRGPNGAQEFSVIREELVQPWCTFYENAMPLNPANPILKCSDFEALEAQPEVPDLKVPSQPGKTN